MYFTVFTRVSHGPYLEREAASPNLHTNKLLCISDYFSSYPLIYAYISQGVSSLQKFQLKICVHFLSLPFVLHAHLILLNLIPIGVQIMKPSIMQWSVLLLPPYQVQIFSLPTYSQSPSVYVPPFM
jgi:hypothetical protein